MSKDREQFIKKYANDVIKAVEGTPIFPSVKMAQFIIESANNKGESGKGITFVKANNGFGIKADKNWTGPKMSFNTPKDGKPVSFFRVYSSPIDSIKDHTAFLQKNKRYSKVFTAKTPEEQVKAIFEAGYSESPTYDKALLSLINAYNLKSLDKQKPTTDNSGIVTLLLLAVGSWYLFAEH